ncbi:DUF3239 domain-containing protein [Rhodococcus spelaei]|uniref:DUF3239 domain-containing protein n=1 Tax=Rhodococcus spelaei TaxID=2546320 RepID=A0A541BPE3_9NOCA|nr:DUF3239 domain-containing protein [Rhodococcus spelaei]TQF74193.1 DUF3239 domain-containing protein [Rhodococcus spelaei]
MRSFEFPVDHAHAKSVNETLGDVRRLRWSSIITALLFAALAVWLFTLAHPWSYIVGVVIALIALTSLWMAYWAPRKVGSIEALYAKGELVPAVVAVPRPRGATLLALVNTAKPSADRPHYALVTRNIRTLPGHSLTHVGERVPSISVLSDRSTKSASDTWQMVSPMPIAWGTRDPKVLRRAAEQISGAEWKLLAKSIPLAEDVPRAENQQIPIAAADLPDNLR